MTQAALLRTAPILTGQGSAAGTTACQCNWSNVSRPGEHSATPRGERPITGNKGAHHGGCAWSTDPGSKEPCAPDSPVLCHLENLLTALLHWNKPEPQRHVQARTELQPRSSGSRAELTVRKVGFQQALDSDSRALAGHQGHVVPPWTPPRPRQELSSSASTSLPTADMERLGPSTAGAASSGWGRRCCPGRGLLSPAIPKTNCGGR